jgi:hypothetical protein
MQALVNKSDLSILVSTRGEWQTPGEFALPDYAVIQVDVPDNMDISRVVYIGTSEPHGDGVFYPHAVVELTEIEVM